MCEINPRQNLFINWEGYVSPCITLAYVRRHYFQGQWRARASVRFGNIREAELPVLWNREPYREFRSTFQRRERVWLAHALTVAAEGNAQPVASFLPEAPLGCQTCYYLYEN